MDRSVGFHPMERVLGKKNVWVIMTITHNFLAVEEGRFGTPFFNSILSPKRRENGIEERGAKK